jgi:hypothetical protein
MMAALLAEQNTAESRAELLRFVRCDTGLSCRAGYRSPGRSGRDIPGFGD